MTYNIAAGRDFSGGLKPLVLNPDACTAVIREEMPAVCGLNEVDYKLPRSGRIKLARHIGDALGYESAFAPAVTWGVGTYGNGFVSKASRPTMSPASFSTPLWILTAQKPTSL